MLTSNFSYRASQTIDHNFESRSQI